jgi:hypothetical protein
MEGDGDGWEFWVERVNFQRLGETSHGTLYLPRTKIEGTRYKN